MIALSNELVAGFHGTFQAAKSFSRRPAFRESALDTLTLNHSEEAIGDIRNDQGDSGKNKIELLKMKTIIVGRKKKNFSGIKEQ